MEDEAYEDGRCAAAVAAEALNEVGESEVMVEVEWGRRWRWWRAGAAGDGEQDDGEDDIRFVGCSSSSGGGGGGDLLGRRLVSGGGRARHAMGGGVVVVVVVVVVAVAVVEVAVEEVVVVGRVAGSQQPWRGYVSRRTRG